VSSNRDFGVEQFFEQMNFEQLTLLQQNDILCFTICALQEKNINIVTCCKAGGHNTFSMGLNIVSEHFVKMLAM
jgi:hypothetical protein